MTGGDCMTEKQQRFRKPIVWGLGLSLLFTVRFLCFTNYMVEGKSMMPTLQEGNLLIVNKLSYQM